MRRGFTLVELSIVIGIMVAIMVAVWAAISHLGNTEKSTDREASRALLQARLAEMLQRDLRSAVKVTVVDDKHYTIDRYVLAGDRLTTRTVTWKQVDEFRVSRAMPPDAPQEFNFRGLLSPDSPGLTFRLEPLGDSVFNAP